MKLTVKSIQTKYKKQIKGGKSLKSPNWEMNGFFQGKTGLS